jgi:hypothetical protein
MEGRPLAHGQVGVGHQLPHGGQVRLGQLAPEQGRQLGQSAGVARIEP